MCGDAAGQHFAPFFQHKINVTLKKLYVFEEFYGILAKTYYVLLQELLPRPRKLNKYCLGSRAGVIYLDNIVLASGAVHSQA